MKYFFLLRHTQRLALICNFLSSDGICRVGHRVFFKVLPVQFFIHSAPSAKVGRPAFTVVALDI